MAETPIDLTTLGAAVPLPPPEHPFWEGPRKSAAVGIPDYHMSGQQMAARIFALEDMVKMLAEKLGVDFNVGT